MCMRKLSSTMYSGLPSIARFMSTSMARYTPHNPGQPVEAAETLGVDHQQIDRRHRKHPVPHADHGREDQAQEHHAGCLDQPSRGSSARVYRRRLHQAKPPRIAATRKAYVALASSPAGSAAARRWHRPAAADGRAERSPGSASPSACRTGYWAPARWCPIVVVFVADDVQLRGAEILLGRHHFAAPCRPPAGQSTAPWPPACRRPAASGRFQIRNGRNSPGVTSGRWPGPPRGRELPRPSQAQYTRPSSWPRKSDRPRRRSNRGARSAARR